MSSWLGGVPWGSLPNTISNFAKEVLTEAEEEVQDPVAELKVARSKLEELEKSVESYRKEWERIKQRNDELSDRSESAEYQIAAISQEYRKLLQSKEEEIKRLKSEKLRLEELSHLVPPGDMFLETGEIHKATSSSLLMAEEGMIEMSLGGDGYDGEAWMGGVAPQQQEVARLQEEVAYLKEQCEQWRKMAEGHVPIDEGSEAPLLNSEVEQLRREVEHHRESLKALSDKHSRELTSLQQQHEEQLQALRDASREKAEELQKRVAELEQPDQIQTQTTIETGNATLSLEREKSRLLAEIYNLEGRICDEQQASQRLKADHSAQQEQMESLSQRIESLSEQLTVKTAEVETLQAQHDSALESFSTLQSTLEHTEAANRSIGEECAGLQRTVSALQKQLMELVVSKQAVGEKLVELCTQVSETRVSLSSVKESASSMMVDLRQEVMGSISAFAAQQQAALEIYHTREAELLSDAESLKEQNHFLSQKLEEANKRDASKQKGEGTDTALEELAMEVHELKELLQSERNSKKRLQDHLAQIVADHDAELSELVEEREKLQESLHEMESASDKSRAGQENEGLMLNTSDGWDDWDMEENSHGGREASTTDRLKSMEVSVASTEQTVSTEKPLACEALRQPQEEAQQVVEDIASRLGMPHGSDVCTGVEDLLREKVELERKMSDMRRESESLRADASVGQAQQLEEVQQALDNVRATLLQREAQLSSVSCQLADTEEKNVSLKAEAEELHQTVSEKTALCTTLEQKVVDLSASLEETRSEGRVTLNELRSLQASQPDHSLTEQLAEAQVTVARLQQSLSEKEAAENEILGERDALTASQAAMANAYSKATQDMSELQAEVGELKEELLKVTQESTGLKQGQGEVKRQQGKISELQTALQQAESEIGSLRETASTLEASLSESVQLIQVKEEAIRALKADKDEREEVLRSASQEQEQVKAKLQESVSKLETDLDQAREELRAVQQQHGAVSHLKAKLAEKEREILSGHQEMDTLREALSAVADEKLTLAERFTALEGELQVAKVKGQEHQQKAASLQQHLLQAQEAHSSTTTVIETKYSVLEAEKDQLVGTLNDVGQENGQLKKTVAELKERQQKTAEKHAEELERLRQHLLQVDGHYTQEALKAEEREVVLRQRLAQLEEEVQRTAQADMTNIYQRDQQLTSLQQQLQALSLQRDDAVLNLSTTQEDLEQTRHELSNLQLVLEQFQKDHVTEVNLTLECTQHELARVEREKEEMEQEVLRLKTDLQETSMSLGNASVLGQELEMKEKQLQRQVDDLQATLNTSQLKLKRLTNQEAEKVDKSLVKNLIHGYLTAPDRKKGEVLRLIANILGFSEQDVGKTVRPQGWLSGWFGGSHLQSPTSRDASFTEMFVTFLEKEAGRSRASAQSPGNLSPSYVDPQTDPDRPSLSTASMRPANVTNPRPPPISSSGPMSTVTPSLSAHVLSTVTPSLSTHVLSTATPSLSTHVLSTATPSLSAHIAQTVTIPITAHAQPTTGSILSAETGSSNPTGSNNLTGSGYATGSMPLVSLSSGEQLLGVRKSDTSGLVAQEPSAVGASPQMYGLPSGGNVQQSSTSQTSLLKDILTS